VTAGPRSRELFERAQKIIPGGVSSPVRAFRAVGGQPIFFARGQGSHLWDVDGKEYIDHVGSWGPLVVGHAHPEVLEAITRAATDGTTFGAPTEREIVYAERLRELMPSLELLRFVSSGTEATMSAIRVARGFTGRDKIVKIDGAYHGHADFLLAAAGSGAATLGIPGSAGVPAATVAGTLVIPWNDPAALRAVFDANPGQIAAVIVEPVCGNMGCVAPADGYLQLVRDVTARDGALFVFDEVMTCFRLGRGGAQARFAIQPDLTCLGKIVGGGLPAAAFGGRADVMKVLAPLGPVYQAGTLSGNPLAVAAGMKTLEILDRPGTWDRLEAIGTRLAEGVRAAATRKGVPMTVNQVGSMWTAFFTPDPVTDYATAKRSDTARFGRFFQGLLERGVYLPPSQFEAAFASLAHTDGDIAQTLTAIEEALG
jgi:glutamate-1-semialdehyde 2,1-aminomutase